MASAGGVAGLDRPICDMAAECTSFIEVDRPP
jgi:hypothetical protein